MIKVSNLKKSFGESVIFEDVNFSLEKGQVTSIIGPSGTGKSTLLRCINLLEQPDSGILELDDKKIDLASASTKEKDYIRSRVSMVFQTFNLYRNKTALENITEPLIVVKGLSKQEAESKALKLLERVGILHRKDSYPVTLSGGEQQRVGIARALGVDSSLILLDEPTSALDPTLVHEVLEVIADLAREHVTMLIVTHEMKFAHDISDEIIFLSNKTILEKGKPDEVFQSPKQPETVEFLKNMSF